MVVQLNSSFTFAWTNEFAVYWLFRHLTTAESFDTPRSRQSFTDLPSEKLSFESFNEPELDEELVDENHEETASLPDVFIEKVERGSKLPNDSFSLDLEEKRKVQQISDSDSSDELPSPPPFLIPPKPCNQSRFVSIKKAIDFYKSLY